MRSLLPLLGLLLAGCAAAPPPSDVLLRLPPASLGHGLELQQRMTVTARGRSQEMAVAIETDEASVRVVIMDFGQPLLRLRWDGHSLEDSRVPGWPDFIPPARVLSDLQLVHWPIGAIRAVLPPGWSIEDEAGTRVLRAQGRAVVLVHRIAADAAELVHVAAGYRVRLEPLSRSAP